MTGKLTATGGSFQVLEPFLEKREKQALACCSVELLCSIAALGWIAIPFHFLFRFPGLAPQVMKLKQIGQTLRPLRQTSIRERFRSGLVDLNPDQYSRTHTVHWWPQEEDLCQHALIVFRNARTVYVHGTTSFRLSAFPMCANLNIMNICNAYGLLRAPAKIPPTIKTIAVYGVTCSLYQRRILQCSSFSGSIEQHRCHQLVWRSHDPNYDRPLMSDFCECLFCDCDLPLCPWCRREQLRECEYDHDRSSFYDECDEREARVLLKTRVWKNKKKLVNYYSATK